MLPRSVAKESSDGGSGCADGAGDSYTAAVHGDDDPCRPPPPPPPPQLRPWAQVMSTFTNGLVLYLMLLKALKVLLCYFKQRVV